MILFREDFVGLREEIIKKIQSAEVQDTDHLEFKKDTVYIRELPAVKKGYGYSTDIEMSVITETQEDNLYEILEQEIGMHGIYGDYFIQKIDYVSESPIQALDKIWVRRLSLKIIWEG